MQSNSGPHVSTGGGCGLRDVPGTFVLAGGRRAKEGGREGRKDVGKELQWAALPVLRRHQPNFKHHLLFDPRQEGLE